MQNTNPGGVIMYSLLTIVNNTILHIWKLLIWVDLKSFHHNKTESCNYVWWQMSTRLIVVFLLHIQISNPYIVHLRLIWCYMTIIPQDSICFWGFTQVTQKCGCYLFIYFFFGEITPTAPSAIPPWSPLSSSALWLHSLRTFWRVHVCPHETEHLGGRTGSFHLTPALCPARDGH